MNWEHHYIVHDPNGYHVFTSLEEAYNSYENSDGYMLMTRTKELFPEYNVLEEREREENSFKFIIFRWRKT